MFTCGCLDDTEPADCPHYELPALMASQPYRMVVDVRADPAAVTADHAQNRTSCTSSIGG